MALSCCLLPYKSVLNKGIILVLVWNLSVVNVIYFLLLFKIDSKIFPSLQHENSLRNIYYAIFGSMCLLLPVFGLIADNYWGRYKMIRRSLFIIWLATIAFCLVSFIPDNLPQADTVREVSYIVLTVILLLSFEAIQASIVQFGLDQIPDASSTESM